ncbi:hypothetical protein E2C01_018710 [Portunus trituberculatus]|uniref:Uncharacterized protein n=1 Tax=Portunus trituberculatus TaxID=210409 RepID=A0A5B7DXA8_PORTR|nr:hypothetical protein [Portunus trituberculatus]
MTLACGDIRNLVQATTGITGTCEHLQFQKTQKIRRTVTLMGKQVVVCHGFTEGVVAADVYTGQGRRTRLTVECGLAKRNAKVASLPGPSTWIPSSLGPHEALNTATSPTCRDIAVASCMSVTVPSTMRTPEHNTEFPPAVYVPEHNTEYKECVRKLYVDDYEENDSMTVVTPILYRGE